MANRIHQMTVYLSPTLAQQVESAARARGWSVSRLLREAARAYLDDSPVSNPPQAHDGPGKAPMDAEGDPEDALEGLAVRP
jgi:hypothetical protein